MTKTTEEWTKELGFRNFVIQALSIDTLQMDPGKGCDCLRYFRPYTFRLMGRNAPCAVLGSVDPKDPNWDTLSDLNLIEFRVDEALHEDVEVPPSSTPHTRPAKLIYNHLRSFEGGASVGGVLFLDTVWVDTSYRGRGVAKHLFDRALAYSAISRQCCVLARTNLASFRETMGPTERFDLIVPPTSKAGPERRKKQIDLLESWGFEPFLSDPDYHVLWLNDTVRESWLK